MNLSVIVLLLIVIFASATNSQEVKCGIHKALRPIIIGGNSTVRGEQPWKTALVRDDGQFFCGGSLVSNKAVVTAAHCINGKDRSHSFTSEDITVVLGAHDLQKSFERGRVSVGVKSIQVHPDWNVDSDSYDGDIALLLLETEIQFGLTIQPICLSKPQSVATQATEGIVIGYGKTESGTPSNIAKKIIAPIKSFHDCVKENQDLKPLLSARTFCGGPGDDKGICEGDSGSGLYVFHDNQFFLRGTASASTLNTYNECDVNTFAIFIDITDYCGWIQSGGQNKYAQCIENEQPESVTTPRIVTPRPTQPPTLAPIQPITEKPIRSTLNADEYLNANEYLQSPNRCFKVYYQTDGNFVVYRASSMQHTWHSQTHGTCTRHAYMQADGNFVVYDCNGAARWHSHTNGHPGARIVIQDDGNLVVYASNNVALWNSRTVTHC